MAKRFITKREYKVLANMQDRLTKMQQRYDEEEGKDIELYDGTVYGNLSCAIAALESILQEPYCRRDE